jgi:SpoVK/Ycf46/Vps4 family AAA+-type ATPase
MPKRFAIRLPNLEQRKKILEIMLATTQLEPGFSLETLARKTDGLSGSDLRETCRNAAMRPVRELMREKGAMGIQGMEQAKKEVRRVALVLFVPVVRLTIGFGFLFARDSNYDRSSCPTLSSSIRMLIHMLTPVEAHKVCRVDICPDRAEAIPWMSQSTRNGIGLGYRIPSVVPIWSEFLAQL